MRLLSALTLLALSTFTLAQGTATSTASAAGTGSYCDAQNILDACINSIQAQVDDCGPNEWDCLCEQTNNLLTCYNNCPGDGGRNGVQQQKVSYCNAAQAAGLYSSTTTSSHSATRTATSTSTEETSASTTSAGVAASETADDGASSVRARLGVAAGLGVGIVLGVF